VFPHEDVIVGVEEIKERAFLFRGMVRANVQHLAIRASGIDRDFLGILCGFKRAHRPLRVGHPLDCLHPDGGELLRGDGHSGELATL
jgi:hypothetical protein